MGQDQVIVLGQLVEDGPGGAGGADGLHGLDVGEQGQAADDVVFIDKGLHQNIRLGDAHMGQVLLHVADGVGEDTAGEGLVQDLTVQGVAVDLGFGGRGGFLRGGSRFRDGLGGDFGRGGGFRSGNRCTATATQQQNQRQGQCENSFHRFSSFRVCKNIFKAARRLRFDKSGEGSTPRSPVAEGAGNEDLRYEI